MSDSTLPPIQLPSPIVHWVISPPYQEQQQQQQQRQQPPIQSEKINQRKHSHSAVEKRRREKMNDKIESLKKLIPSCGSPFPTTVQQPIHKLSVLQAAIDYIGQLHDQIENTLPEDDPLRQQILMPHLTNKN
jgi:hypothetical protein